MCYDQSRAGASPIAGRIVRVAFAGVVLALAPVASADEPPAVFRDRTADLGLTIANAAACWVDVNGDGWADLCTGGAVWRNDAGKRFTRIAEGLGDVVAADFDNDGFVDLFSYSAMRVFRNDSGKKFVPIDMPMLPRSVSRGACWGDFNGDSYVDLYVGGYEDWDANVTWPSMLLMNEKGKAFKVAWTDARYRARGVTACDFDGDGVSTSTSQTTGCSRTSCGSTTERESSRTLPPTAMLLARRPGSREGTQSARPGETSTPTESLTCSPGTSHTSMTAATSRSPAFCGISAR